MRFSALALVLLAAGCKPSTPPASVAASAAPAASLAAATPASAIASVTAIAPKASLFDASFDVHGTEPFWTLTIDPKAKAGFSFEPADGDAVETPYTRAVLTGDTKASFVSGDIAVTLVKEACSDGIADEVFSYSAALTIKGKALKGCAKRNRPPGEPDWTAIVPEALPVIDACLTKGNSTQLTLARRGKGDLIEVYVDGSNGNRFVCQASLKTPIMITSWEEIQAGTNAEGERDPSFIRAIKGASPGECGNETAIKDKAGKLVGWAIPNEEC